MASPKYTAVDYWPSVTVFEEEEVMKLFEDFEILRFNVHKYSGETPSGEQHDWHIFSVVAKKTDEDTNNILMTSLRE